MKFEVVEVPWAHGGTIIIQFKWIINQPVCKNGYYTGNEQDTGNCYVWGQHID